MTKRKASVALETGNESNQSTSTQDNNSTSDSTLGNNNNQPNQNGSGSGNGDNNGSQHKNKKERADNWSSAEIQVLHRGIDTRRDIFYGPPSQATKKNRELAWEAITKEVNSVSTTPRSLSQVMKKFKNEKCRAKRKFGDSDKDGHNSLTGNNGVNNTMNSNANGANNSSNNTGLNAQNHVNSNHHLQSQPSQQLQQQSHHMTNSDQITSQPSINVVKLAPQNVAKTMIDLPGHVQQIQMPNDDMVLIVPPDMDGLLSGMNIVSDALNNQQHNHHGQHTLQAINAGPSLVNGTMGNGMMARTIPASTMCSIMYSTGAEVCGTEQHVANSVSGPTQMPSNHIGINAQNLIHHRTNSVEHNQGQQNHHHQSHQQHQQQQQALPQQAQHQQQQQQHQQQQPQQQQQHHHQPQPVQHHQHSLQQSHLTPSTAAATTLANGGVAVESQLKNLLFNLLLKEGQHSMRV